MAITLEMSQEMDIRADWKKLAEKLKEEFKIDESEEEIEIFLCEIEPQILTTEIYEPEIEEQRTNDQTGDLVTCEEE